MGQIDRQGGFTHPAFLTGNGNAGHALEEIVAAD
jgi:hypothetical protein